MIDVLELTFAYDGSYENIFENVSFRMDTDWKLGFTGRNGRGKTTFLNLLQGKYEYQGSISARADFEYFPYTVTDTQAPAADAVREIAPQAQDWELMRELNLMDFDLEALYRPYMTLSNGERTKLLLAAMFLHENGFLLIDEPTNHLDMEGRAAVSRYLAQKKGFILVSHDRAFLDGCVDHILSINRTNIEIQKGSFSSWYYNKELQDGFERAENEKLKGEIVHLTAAARRTAGWSDAVEKTRTAAGDSGYVGHKSAKMMKRSKAIENRRETVIEEKSKLLKNIETADRLKISPLAYRQPRLISIREVGVDYGSRTVCSNVTFNVERGDRVALTGKNGCGKSSLIKLMLGEDIPHTGHVERGTGLTVSYVPQDTSFLSGDLTEYIRREAVEESLVKAILRKLDFSREQFYKDMSSYSAGQKKKVLIAVSLAKQAHLYIWDEPLNYIDVFSRMQIERLLAEFSPTMVFVEHDKKFVENAATLTVRL